MNTFMNDIEKRLADPLGVAREAGERGQRIIGYVGDDVPVELILAADALPVRLSGTVEGATPLADRYLESSFGPAHRSLVEHWLNGALNFLDAIVFSRSNDSAQRLYYYLCELQRRKVCAGPTPLIFDVSRIRRETSVAHTLAVTEGLARQLGASAERLEAAVQRLHARAALGHTLTSLRTRPSAIAGSDALRIWRALHLDWTDGFDASVHDWLTHAPSPAPATRLMLVGSTPPDERFYRAAESAGGNIVDELFDEAPVHALTRWSKTAATFAAIATAYRSAASTAMTMMNTPDAVLARAQATNARGVILWLIEQDEGIVWEVPRQIERLQRAGIPVLALTRQAWNADESTLARIAAFVRESGSAT